MRPSRSTASRNDRSSSAAIRGNPRHAWYPTTSTAGPQPAAASRSRSEARSAPARQSGVKEKSVVPRRVMPSEHRVVVGGRGGPRLEDVPVLDDAVTVGAVDVHDSGGGSAVALRPQVQRADVAV